MFSIRITSRKIWYRSLHTKPPAAVFLETQKEHSFYAVLSFCYYGKAVSLFYFYK